jgi:hypothetical protein
MTPLVFLWTLGAVAGTVATLTSWATLALPWVAGRGSSAWRADAAWLLGAAPAIAAATVTLASASPGLRAFVDRTVDHCEGHAHHAHLCWQHGPSSVHVVAALGAVWWVVVLARGARVALDAARTARLAHALTALGTADGRVVRVPTGAPLCHAVGHLRPRVLVSDAVWHALPVDEREAVLAHEDAHLRRRDPTADLLLAVLGVVAWPASARTWRARWRTAAEGSADADAASRTDPGALASALVRVARLGLADVPIAPGLAATTHALELRVTRLLAGDAPVPGPARWVQLAGVVALGAALTVLAASDPVHHLVEDVVSAVTRAVASAYYYR